MRKYDLAAKGRQIIYYAARDEMKLSDSEISEIVSEIKRNPDSNIEWHLAMLGDSGTPKEESYVKKNSIDLPTDFK